MESKSGRRGEYREQHISLHGCESYLKEAVLAGFLAISENDIHFPSESIPKPFATFRILGVQAISPCVCKLISQ